MRFVPIASSSHGNAYLVTDGDSRILLDCGVSFKRLQSALDYQAQELEGCLLTHEHKDHAGHVGQLIKRGVPVYASPGTVTALGLEGVTPLLMLHGNELGAPFRLGSFTVVPFRVQHDAAEPVGYLLRGSDGELLAFATDLGNTNARFPGVNILALEANYDEELISLNSRIPEQVAKRVRLNHMEIHRLCAILSRQDLSRCRELWLLHLSDGSSSEGRFIDLVERVVGDQIRVQCAPRG